MTVATMPQTLYADIDDLKTRVRLDTLLECLDWNRDGVIDTVAAAAILEPASTDIDMELQTCSGIYPEPFRAPFPPSLRDLALDGAQWRLGALYPTFYVIDHMTLRVDTRKRLDRIRTGQLNLGQKPAEPSAIQGGRIWPDLSKVSQKPAIFIQDGTGRWGGVY